MLWKKVKKIPECPGPSTATVNAHNVVVALMNKVGSDAGINGWVSELISAISPREPRKKTQWNRAAMNNERKPRYEHKMICLNDKG